MVAKCTVHMHITAEHKAYWFFSYRYGRECFTKALRGASYPQTYMHTFWFSFLHVLGILHKAPL